MQNEAYKESSNQEIANNVGETALKQFRIKDGRMEELVPSVKPDEDGRYYMWLPLIVEPKFVTMP